MANRYGGGGSRSSLYFKWQREDYTPVGLRQMPTEEVNKEYSRLRDIAMKRMKRLAQSEFAQYGQAQNFLHYYAPRFKKLKDMPSPEYTRRALSDLRYFLDSPYGSASGYREVRRKQIKTMHDHGLKFVNTQNLDEFVDFMEYVKSTSLGAMLYSVEDALFFEEAEKEGISGEELKAEWEAWKTKNEERKSDMVNRFSSEKETRSTAARHARDLLNMGMEAMIKRGVTNRAKRSKVVQAIKKPRKRGKS